jgi:hypothetical protein
MAVNPSPVINPGPIFSGLCRWIEPGMSHPETLLHMYLHTIVFRSGSNFGNWVRYDED